MEFSKDALRKEYEDIHLAYYDYGRLIGCLVLTKKSKYIVRMRQVAVDTGWQKKGIGKALVLESERIAKKAGYKKMVLHARDVAVAFYKKLNYKKTDKPFVEVGIKHFSMEKTL